jgi:hypothetical protein
MLDLFIANDLIQRRLQDQFEMGARADRNVQGAGQEQRPRRHTVSALDDADSLQRLPFGGSLMRMRRLIARRRSTTRTAAEC